MFTFDKLFLSRNIFESQRKTTEISDETKSLEPNECPQKRGEKKNKRMLAVHDARFLFNYLFNEKKN